MHEPAIVVKSLPPEQEAALVAKLKALPPQPAVLIDSAEWRVQREPSDAELLELGHQVLSAALDDAVIDLPDSDLRRAGRAAWSLGARPCDGCRFGVPLAADGHHRLTDHLFDGARCKRAAEVSP